MDNNNYRNNNNNNNVNNGNNICNMPYHNSPRCLEHKAIPQRNFIQA